jgi:hypothetical protein
MNWDEYNRKMDFNIVGYEKYLLGADKEWCQMSPLALKWIEIFLTDLTERTKRKIKILEFGAGVSTLWFGSNFPEADVVSIEGDADWNAKISGWLNERKISNVRLIYQKQHSNYRLDDGMNEDYFKVCYSLKPPFDLIINDGAIREFIGDEVLDNADELISNGGLYLRHDYEKALNGDWIGFHSKPLKPWVNNENRLCYDGFTVSHPEYDLLTVSGNGKWGYKSELGGVWRRLKL